MHNKIKVYYQNVRGLRTKASDFSVSVLKNDFHIYCLTETFLTSDQIDSDYFPSNYHVFRSDRTGKSDNRRGEEKNRADKGENRAGKVDDHGGVLTAVSKELKCFRRYDLEEDFEAVWLEIHIEKNAKLLLGNIYLRPRLTLERYNELTSLLETHLPVYKDDIVLLGDFNIPGVDWPNSDCSDCRSSVKDKAQAIVDFSHFCNLNQINRVANYQGKYLDLCFVKENNVALQPCEVSVVTMDQYHPSISLTYTIKASIDKNTNVEDTSYLYENGDYDALFSRLQSADWSEIYHATDVDTAVQVFTSSVASLVSVRSQLNGHSVAKRLADFFSGVAEDRNNPELYCSLVQRSSDLLIPKSAWMHYREMAKDNWDPALFMTTIKHSKDWLAPTCNGTSPGQRITKSDRQLMVKSFGEFYSEMGTDRCNPREAVPDYDISPNNFFSLKITEEDVLKAIRKLNFNRTAGPDGIPNFVMKIGAEVLAPVLVHLFNLSLQTSRYPKMWKRVFVSPVWRKGRQQEDINKYRPVSILNSVAMIFDHVMYNHLFNWFKVHLPESQHGYAQGRSVETNLLSFSNYVEPFVTKSRQVDTVYVDLSTGFERVSHRRLSEKLLLHGLSDSLLDWCKDYLSERTNVVKCDGAVTSIPSRTNCGVQRGSSLGSLLFNIYSSDLPPLINSAKLFQFGERIKIVKPIVTKSDCADLQRDVDKLVEWCVSNNLTVSHNKAVVVSFSRKVKNIHYDYTLNNVLLKRDTVLKDLGIFFDNQLKFDSHIEKTVKKCNKMLGRCYGIAKLVNSELCFLTLYKAVVLPSITNGSLIYSNADEFLLSRLESVQKRFVSRLNWRSTHPPEESYESRIEELNFTTISERLVKNDIKFLDQIYNGKLDCPSVLNSLYLNCTTYNLRKRHLFYVRKHSSVSMERLMSNYNKFGYAQDIFNRDISESKNRLIDFNNFVTLIFKLFVVFTYSDN